MNKSERNVYLCSALCFLISAFFTISLLLVLLPNIFAHVSSSNWFFIWGSIFYSAYGYTCYHRALRRRRNRARRPRAPMSRGLRDG